MATTVDSEIGGVLRQKGLSVERLKEQRAALDALLRNDPTHRDAVQEIDERAANIKGFDLRIKELLGMDGAQELMDLENKEENDD